MPFGPDCQYADFQACKDANRDRDDPDAYCAAIQRRTEGHCNMSDKLEGYATLADADDIARALARVGAERTRLRRPLARQPRDWYRISAKAEEPAPEPASGGSDEGGEPTRVGDTTIIDIYDEISWASKSAQEFVRDLRGIKTPKIEVHLNSPGGDVFDAIAIYNGLRQHKAQVHVIVDSLAASSASFIAMAGDKVTAMANAMMMIHDPWGLVIGNAADMRDLADLLDKHGDNIAAIYAQRAGGEVADWRGRMQEETWYLADEAYAAGLVDQVDDADGRPIEDRWDLSIFTRQPEQTPSAERPAAAMIIPVADTACPTHHTATVDGTWEKGPNEKRLPSPMSVATAKKAYGYYDADKVEDGQVTKDACKLLHHQVSADGVPGVAHLGGVRAALSRLGQSATEIPDSEHDAIERHLNAHLEDAPQDATAAATRGNGDGSRRQYLGETATWYLPHP